MFEIDQLSICFNLYSDELAFSSSDFAWYSVKQFTLQITDYKWCNYAVHYIVD